MSQDWPFTKCLVWSSIILIVLYVLLIFIQIEKNLGPYFYFVDKSQMLGKYVCYFKVQGKNKNLIIMLTKYAYSKHKYELMFFKQN